MARDSVTEDVRIPDVPDTAEIPDRRFQEVNANSPGIRQQHWGSLPVPSPTVGHRRNWSDCRQQSWKQDRRARAWASSG